MKFQKVHTRFGTLRPDVLACVSWLGSCPSAGVGWRLEVNPRSHPISQLQFDVVVGADGRRNTLPGRWDGSAQDPAELHNVASRF